MTTAEKTKQPKQAGTTKTFAGRMDEKRLATVEAITQREARMSYGQWCTELAEVIETKGKLPSVRGVEQSSKDMNAWKSLVDAYRSNPKAIALGKMTDEEIRSLVVKRYEA